MLLRSILSGLGAGIAATLVVTVLVIELLAFEFSALIGVPVGILAGIGVAVGVALTFSRLEATGRRVAVAIAGFGYVAIALLAVSYLNLAGLRSAIGPDVVLAGALLALLFVYLATGGDRGRALVGTE